MHYYGWAITEDGQRLDDLMEPFDENNERYFSLRLAKDSDEAWEYENNGVYLFVDPNGNEMFPWAKRVPKELSDVKLGEYDRERGLMVYPEDLGNGWRSKYVAYKDMYPTLNDYASEFCGYTIIEPKDLLECWGIVSDEPLAAIPENANGQYDYYRIAGRWCGGLKLKKNADGARGAECWEVAEWRKHHPDEELYDEGCCDIAMLDDIVEDGTTVPYFIVTPDGKWVDGFEWGQKNFMTQEEKDEQGVTERFWSEQIEPLRGKGLKVTAIDIHV